jgi:2-iminobutanoate/2-iminopropanoate deaminase
MDKSAVTTERIAPPAGPFSPAVRSGGTLYLSGQVAQDPSTGRIVAGDVSRQTEQIFANVSSVLEAAGMTFANVVRVGVFLTDIRDFQAMNAAYARFFEAPYPARTTVAVAALPLGAAVEIDLVAQ